MIPATKKGEQAGFGPPPMLPPRIRGVSCTITSKHGAIRENWQFLRLAGTDLTYDQKRLYIDNVPEILATFAASVQLATPVSMDSVA